MSDNPIPTASKTCRKAIRLNYHPCSTYFTIRCNETMEEKDFETEADCIEWSKRLSHCLQNDFTFVIACIEERSVEIWTEYKNDKWGIIT